MGMYTRDYEGIRGLIEVERFDSGNSRMYSHRGRMGMRERFLQYGVDENFNIQCVICILFDMQ